MKKGGITYIDNNFMIAKRFPDGSVVMQGKRVPATVPIAYVAAYRKSLASLVALIKDTQGVGLTAAIRIAMQYVGRNRAVAYDRLWEKYGTKE